MTIRNLTNISTAPIILDDLNGLTIAVSETVDGLVFGEEALRNSNSVVTEILAGHLTVNDGAQTYINGQAVNVIRGLPTRVSQSGSAITTMSDRPTGCRVYFTSSGDDTVNNIDGAGTPFEFIVTPGATQTIDAFFNNDMYIKEGKIYYTDTELGSYVSVDILAPANTPFPANGNGNYDIVNGVPVENLTNTGQYFILPTETLFLKYVNKYPLFSYRMGEISSPEPDLLPKGIGIRLTVHNAHASVDLKAAVVFYMYKNTGAPN